MRCVVTPYLIPQSSSKTVNVGDGIILHAVERLLGRFPRELTFSARVLPAPAQLAVMEDCSEVILAGANQLTDDYTVWPGFDRAALARTNLKLVPVGIGIHGEASRNTGMSDATRGIISLLHDRLAYSSWRCPRTVEYLNRSMPALRGRFLMTGCPALFDRLLLSEQRFWQGQDVVAVTPTERGDFWKREAAVIDFVARRFRSSRRLLVVHQDYKAAGPRQTTRSKLASMLVSDKRSALRRLAQSRGFEVVVPASAEAALALYETVDLHIGSRLHAHLHLLSQNRRSFLTKVDERITGFAEHFGFPICDPLRLDDYMDFDFEPVRERARRTFEVMCRFVDSL